MINGINNSSPFSRASSSSTSSRDLVTRTQVESVSQVSSVQPVQSETFTQSKRDNFVFPKVLKLDENSAEMPLIDRRRRFVQQQPGFQRPTTRYQLNQQMPQRQELDQMVGIDVRV